MESNQSQIFICHSIEDLTFATWLSDSLRSLGHSIWMSAENRGGGQNRAQVIQQALDSAEVMLLIITSEALQSPLVNSQWTYFYMERQKKIIPIVLRSLKPTDKLNFILTTLQNIDFFREDHETALLQLHQTLLEEYSGSFSYYSPTKIPSSYLMPPPTHNPDKHPLEMAGMTGIHFSLPSWLFRQWVEEMPKTIRILNTWSGIFYDYPHLLIEAAELGCTIQVLLLDPSSPFAKQRSRDLHIGKQNDTIDEDEVPKNIQASIRFFAGMYGEYSNLHNRFELRLYHAMPAFSFHQCDHKALIGFYPYAIRMVLFPMLEIEMKTELGEKFGYEFEALWNASTTIDLSPRIPARVVNANQALTEPLSTRELEILNLIGAGLSNQEIALKLVVTPSTVKKHINNLYSKLGVNSTASTNPRTYALIQARHLNLL